MIQRIQTIYLLVVFILEIVLCCFPMAEAGGVILEFGSRIVYTGLILIAPVITLLAILMFRKRIAQMRLCSLSIIIMAITIIVAAVDIYMAYQPGTAALYWPTVIPPINIILTYLAIRAIGKDEALVRSLDRLR